MINLIVCVNEVFAIGDRRTNDLLYKIKEDILRFKEITSKGNSYVICGRNTWNSLPIKPLPNRKNVVITRNRKFSTEYPNVIIEHDVDKIISHHLSSGYIDSTLNIIGGVEIYSLFLPYVDNIYLTMVHDKMDSEDFIHFPSIELNNFKQVKTEKHYSEEHDLFYSFIDYVRK